jgi:RNA-directed DNA polymerase
LTSRSLLGGNAPGGFAALADTRGQQAVVTRLTQLDEEDGRGFSTGCRPGRRPHQALDALAGALPRTRVHDGLDGAMRGFVAKLAHAWWNKVLQPRGAEPHVRICAGGAG